MQCTTEHGCLTGFPNGQFNSRRLDLGNASPTRHTLVLVQVSAYSTSWATQWGKPRSHGLQRAMQYPNPPTKMYCRAMLYDVIQIYNILVQASVVLPNTGRTAG